MTISNDLRQLSILKTLLHERCWELINVESKLINSMSSINYYFVVVTRTKSMCTLLKERKCSVEL